MLDFESDGPHRGRRTGPAAHGRRRLAASVISHNRRVHQLIRAAGEADDEIVGLVPGRQLGAQHRTHIGLFLWCQSILRRYLLMTLFLRFDGLDLILQPADLAAIESIDFREK